MKLAFIIRKVFSLLVLFFLVHTLNGQSHSVSLISKEELLTKIQIEKDRITIKYSEYSRVFNIQLDSTIQYIETKTPEKNHALYLSRLYFFLSEIDKYYSREYFNSGRYNEALAYFPTLIEWNESKELVQKLSLYKKYSLKAVSLIPSDDAVSVFLNSEKDLMADEILRNTDAFYDRPCALNILEYIAVNNPESVKKYLGTTNQVNKILSNSTNPTVKLLYQIFKNYGFKSNAYTLVDDITSRKLSISQADSIQSFPFQFSKHLVSLLKKDSVSGSKSVSKLLANYSIETARILNSYALNQNGQLNSSDLNKYSKDHLFTVMLFGYREFTSQVFFNLIEQMILKQERYVDYVMLENIDKRIVAEFFTYAEEAGHFNNVLSLFDPKYHNQLKSFLLFTEEMDDYRPTLNFFNSLEFANSQNILTWVTPFLPSRNISDVNPDSKETVLCIKPGEVNLNEKTEANNEVIKKEEKSAISKDKKSADGVIEKTDAVVPPMDASIGKVCYKISFSEEDKEKFLLIKNPVQSMQQLPQIIDKKSGKEFLMYMAKEMPDEVFKRVDYFKSKVYAREVLEVAAINAPVTANRYLYSRTHTASIILAYSSDLRVKTLLDMHNKIGNSTRALCLLDEVFNKVLSIEQAVELSGNSDKFFPHLLKLSLKRDLIGIYSLEKELNNYCLRKLRDINDKIAQNNPNPFQGVDNFSSEELLALMINGRDEVFTSTLKGLLQRFLAKVPEKTAEYFNRYTSDNNLRKFISLCGIGSSLPVFTQAYPEKEVEKIFFRFLHGLESVYLKEVTLVAECLSNSNSTVSNKYMHQYLKEEFESMVKLQSQRGISYYGLLINIVADKAAGDRVWFKEVSSGFRSTSVNNLAISNLMGNKNLCIEQVYFYDDADGRGSYNNFVRTFKSHPNWSFEDNNSYVKIASKSGNRVEIYANKPEFEQSGISAIRDLFRANKLEPSFTIHRGYSFHTESTIEYLTKSSKLVFLGSCGGFYKIGMAMNNAPEAQYIATKQIGTLNVNDPLILALNEKIRNNIDIHWQEFWVEMESKLSSNPLFYDYIPPHKNLEFLLSKAFYNLVGI